MTTSALQQQRAALLLRMLLCISLGFAAAEQAAANQVSFASVFQGGAVLQSGEEVSIWGTASGASALKMIDLSLDGKHLGSAKPNEFDGGWVIKISAQNVSWSSVLTAQATSGAAASVTVKFGQTILCSGQSNMQMPVANWSVGGFSAANGTAEAAAAGRYTGKIALMTIQNPFPMPTVAKWNGTYCPGWPHQKDPLCTSQPEW